MTWQPWFTYTLPIVVVLLAILVKIALGARRDAAQSRRFVAFRRSPAASAATAERQRQLRLGLMHGEAINAYVDSLRTGLDKRAAASSLNDLWNISTSEQAQSTLGWLLMQGHRATWPHVLAIVRQHAMADWTASVYSLGAQVDRDQLQSHLDHLAETLPQLQEWGVLSSQADLGRGIVAWDMGRAVHVARLCFDCGLVTEAQAWEVIAYAAATTARELTSWDEVAKSTLIGLAMWAGPGEMLNNMKTISDACLNDADSPWKAPVPAVSEPASSPT